MDRLAATDDGPRASRVGGHRAEAVPEVWKVRRKLARLLRRMADYLEPPSAPTELGDLMAMMEIDQRQAMREGFKEAVKAAVYKQISEEVEPIGVDDLLTKDVSVKVEPE